MKGERRVILAVEQIEREYPYVRRLPLFAVYDVIDRLGGRYDYDERSGTVSASLPAYGLESGFSIFLRDGSNGTRLTISITEPNGTLTELGRERALRFVADAIDQHIETTLGGQKLPPDLGITQGGERHE